MASFRNMARLGVAALLVGSSPVAALTIEYCSAENTASSSTESMPHLFRLDFRLVLTA